MKKMIFSLGMTIAIIFLSGCINGLYMEDVHNIEQKEICIVEAWRTGDFVIEPPQLFVSLNETGQSVRAISRHMGYGVHYKDGTIAGGADFDSPHPSTILTEDFSASTLQLTHKQDIPLDLVVIEFTYGNPPSTNPYIVSVTRWRAEYAAEACWYYGGETIELVASGGWTSRQIDYMIPVFDDGYDYVYVVQPRWQEGQIRWHSLFAFRINSGGHPELVNVPEYVSSDYEDVAVMDFATFLELLELNGFLYEEGQELPGGTISSPLSVIQKVVYVDSERIRVEIYDSTEVMERASALIGITCVASPDEPDLPTFQVTWVPEASPRWFKRDLIIVFYSGNDSRIIDFLVENLTFFVGFDIDKVE